MIAIGLLFVRMLRDCFKSRRQLEAEILVLRHVEERGSRPATQSAAGTVRSRRTRSTCKDRSSAASISRFAFAVSYLGFAVGTTPSPFKQAIRAARFAGDRMSIGARSSLNARTDEGSVPLRGAGCSILSPIIITYPSLPSLPLSLPQTQNS